MQYFAADERVGAFAAFDEVASGNAQIYHAATYYWKGKHPGLNYFSSVPFGMIVPEFEGWMRWLGGQELFDEITAEFGIKGILGGNTGVQMGGWFRKEINSVDDMQGLKFRMPGLGGDVLAKLGASPVSLPGSQVYENLISGAIDGTEWATPFMDSSMKFWEVAKYYYYPGLHEPGTALTFGMNKSWWDSLPKSDQTLIEGLCHQTNFDLYTESTAKSGEWLHKFITEQGVELRKFNEDIIDAFGEATQEVFEEVRQHSPLAKKIDDSFRQSMASLAGWLSVAEIEYFSQRNRVLGIGI